jgi:hypothetical protein
VVFEEEKTVMPFPCPSPKGTNFAGLYLDRGGNLIDRNGALWGRRGTMAHDSLPDSLRAAGGSSHLPPQPEFGPEHDSVRKHTLGDENDEERGVEALRRWLFEHTGLSENAIDEACEIAAKEHGEPAEDYLPASGLRSAGGMGGRLSNARSRLGEGLRPPLGTKSSSEERSMLGEATYRSSPASDGFAFPKENLMPHYEPPESERRSSARARRLAADAVSDAAGESLLRLFGPDGPARIGIGEWPKRR